MKYSELRKQPRVELETVLPLAMPWTVQIETTNACNLRCQFCPRSRADYLAVTGGPTRVMGLAMYSGLMEELTIRPGYEGVRSIRLYGEGEPLLDPHIGDRVRLAKGTGGRVEITTNGFALTPGKGMQLVNAGLDYLRVSAYGTTREEMRATCQKDLAPQTVVFNLAVFNHLRATLGRPSVTVKTFYPEAVGWWREQLGEAADEVVCNEGLHNWAGLFDEGVKARKAKRVCPAPFYSVMVRSNGDVLPCCVDWRRVNRLGNLKEQSLRDIWNGEKAREFRRLHLDGRRRLNAACSRCDYLTTMPDDLDHCTRKTEEMI